MKKIVHSLQQFPPQIRYIIGNEACERFSFYGMRCILVVFMTHHLMYSESDAQAIFHLFVSACYLLPLLGAFIADKLWGKYKTILFISLFYCAGHAVLSIWENRTGLYVGLALIAFGAGGIKPCVSSFVGDQFTKNNKTLIQSVYDIFYWSINFGSFSSTLLTPYLLAKYGSGIAFAIPGVLMGIATLIFWLGRKQYIVVPPTKKEGVPFLPIAIHALRKGYSSAKKKFKTSDVDAVDAAVSIFKVFITISFFWALWDQSFSSWILQGEKMNRNVLGVTIESSQMVAVNPILILSLIPIFSHVIYPGTEKLFKFKWTPLRKIGVGMVFTALSFVVVGILQSFIDKGVNLSIAWQIVPNVILAISEIMVSITGLEFAYTQAPKSMKSTIMSFFFLTTFFGNLLTAIIAKLNIFSGATYFFFFAAMMFSVTFIFAAMAKRYKVREYLAT